MRAEIQFSDVLIAIGFVGFSFCDSLFGYTASAAPLLIIVGDRLKLDGTTFRINSIDASEFCRKCRKSGKGMWPCGKEERGCREA